MYTADFLVHFSACTSLRELSICMHVGHILKRDTYDEMRDYIKFKSDAWIANGSQVELKSLVNVLTLLPAVQVLNANCAITAWDYVIGFGPNAFPPRLAEVGEEILNTV
jgi:hypothetical protein